MTETQIPIVKPEDIGERLGQFINEWPLYGPFEIQFTEPPGSGPGMPGTILRECNRCKSVTTWWKTPPRSPGVNTPSPAQVLISDVGNVYAYKCIHCSKNTVWLWIDYEYVRGEEDTLTGMRCFKLGQYPAQTISPPRKVAKSLDDPTLDFYKKGLTSLYHGYGLGAVSYFRRVVEDATGVLIGELIARAKENADTKTVEKLTEAEESRTADDKLRLAADALPAELRPGGVNPLATLYQQYSRSLHGLSDTECLNVAQKLRFTLEYTFENWLKEIEEARRFRAEVQEWNDPTSQPEAKAP